MTGVSESCKLTLRESFGLTLLSNASYYQAGSRRSVYSIQHFQLRLLNKRLLLMKIHNLNDDLHMHISPDIDIWISHLDKILKLT